MSEGRIVERCDTQDGLETIGAADHASVLRRLCGDWLDRDPRGFVLLTGKVGGNDGWVPTPYIACPAGTADIADHLIPVALGGGRTAYIAPGVACHAGMHIPDLTRGEEVLALGAEVEDGLVCVPGECSKWLRIREGRIVHIRSYVTGDVHALVRSHLGLAPTPEREPDFQAIERGIASTLREESGGPEGGFPSLLSSVLVGAPRRARTGVLHTLFEAQAGLITGQLGPREVGCFLWGLLIGHEVEDGLRTYPAARVTLVADAPRAEAYRRAFARHEVEVTIRPTEDCLARGALRVMAANPPEPLRRILWPVRTA